MRPEDRIEGKTIRMRVFDVGVVEGEVVKNGQDFVKLRMEGKEVTFFKRWVLFYETVS